MELLRSNKSIAAAIAANVVIAAIKLVAAAVTGSSSMAAEGIHSIVDLGNGVLLLHGVRTSRRPPDAAHPFGHGQDVYFWTLMVAIVVFALGGGLSLYEGILHLRPHPMTSLGWSFGVLLAAGVFELSSFVIARREFERDGGTGSLWKAVRRSKDPSRFAVLFEDAAAIVGVGIALAATGLTAWLGRDWIDGAGSICIGLVLAATAVMLAREARGLLIGEGVSLDVSERARGAVRDDPAVASLADLLTMYLGPHEVLMVARVTLAQDERLSSADLTRRRLEERLRALVPDLAHFFLEVQPPSKR